MGYGRALANRGLNAAAGIIKRSPLGAAYSAVSSLWGGGIDRRARSLKALRRAASKGDLATIQRKASSSKYTRVRGIASQLLAGANTYQDAKVAYMASKGTATVGAGPMVTPVLKADPVAPHAGKKYVHFGSTRSARRATAARKTKAKARRKRSSPMARRRGRKTRLKFGSRAWQLRYNPNYRRRRRR